MNEGTQLVEVRLSRESDGLPLDKHVVLYVEARADDDVLPSEGEVSSRIVDSLTDALDAIRLVSAQIAQSIKDAGPDRFTIQLGFELKAEAGGLVAMLVRTGGTATMQVTLEWQGGTRSDNEPSAHEQQ